MKNKIFIVQLESLNVSVNRIQKSTSIWGTDLYCLYNLFVFFYLRRRAKEISRSVAAYIGN